MSEHILGLLELDGVFNNRVNEAPPPAPVRERVVDLIDDVATNVIKIIAEKPAPAQPLTEPDEFDFAAQIIARHLGHKGDISAVRADDAFIEKLSPKLADAFYELSTMNIDRRSPEDVKHALIEVGLVEQPKRADQIRQQTPLEKPAGPLNI